MRRLGFLDADVVAVADAIAGFGGLAVDLHASGVDDALHDGTAVVGEHRDQIQIEAEMVPALGHQFDKAVVGGKSAGRCPLVSYCRSQLARSSQRPSHHHLLRGWR